MEGLEPQPPLSSPEESRGYNLTFRGIVLPNDAPRPTDADSWELHYTDDERAHLRLNTGDLVGDPVAFNHQGISHVPWESSRGTGSVRKVWFSRENNMCFEMGVYDTEEGSAYADDIRAGRIRFLSLAHVCVPTEPGEPDLTQGLKPGWKKKIYEVSIIPTEIGPGREGCNIDIPNAVSTRAYHVDRSKWTAYCASRGIKKADVDEASANIVITDVPVTLGSGTVVSWDKNGAGESTVSVSGEETEEPSVSSAEAPAKEDHASDEPPMYPESEKDALSQENAPVQDPAHTHSSDPQVTATTMNMSDPTATQAPETAAPMEGVSKTNTEESAPPASPETEASSAPEAKAPETTPKSPTEQDSSESHGNVGSVMRDFIETLSAEDKEKAMKDPMYAFALKIKMDAERISKMEGTINEQAQAQARADAEAQAQAAQVELQTGLNEIEQLSKDAIASFGHGGRRPELEMDINVCVKVLQRALQDESKSVEAKRAAIATARNEIEEFAKMKDETEGGPNDWLAALTGMTVQTGVSPSAGGFGAPAPVVTVKANSSLKRETHSSQSASRSGVGMSLDALMAHDLPHGSLVDLESKNARELFGKAPGYEDRARAIILDLKKKAQYTKVEANSRMTRSSVAMGGHNLAEPGQECDPPSNDQVGLFHIPTADPVTGKGIMRTTVHPLLNPGTQNMFRLARRSMSDGRPHQSKLTAILNDISFGERLPGVFASATPELTFVADEWAARNPSASA